MGSIAKIAEWQGKSGIEPTTAASAQNEEEFLKTLNYASLLAHVRVAADMNNDNRSLVEIAADFERNIQTDPLPQNAVITEGKTPMKETMTGEESTGAAASAQNERDGDE